MDAPVLEPVTTEEIKWDTLTHALHFNRCVLFLGPFLPLYTKGETKVDFNSLTALHLAEELDVKGAEFDRSQSQNLPYIAQKFIAFNNNYRPSLEDEISKLYSKGLMNAADSDGDVPALYKKILMLPWHTIVNMQPDSFFEKNLKPTDVFSYYHYKSKDADLKIDEDQLLIYNLFGAIVKNNNKYRTDSVVLTEDDQVELVRNMVSGNPHVPDSVISRFDNDKIYIFLDCNLENWYFRLVMEILKIHKESHAFSLRPSVLNFSVPTIEFYKKRYGFVFINNNSEEFINKFKEKYDEEYPPPAKNTKKIFIAYDDSAGDLLKCLTDQFEPWIKKDELSIWSRDKILAGDNTVLTEKEELGSADIIILLVNARFLANNDVGVYMQTPAGAANKKEIFAIIENSCPWDESPVKNLSPKNILPHNYIPVKVQQQQNPVDKIVYDIVKSITSNLWD